MNESRRKVLKSSCVLGVWSTLTAAGLIIPSAVGAGRDLLFEAVSLEQALLALGVEALHDSEAVQITVAGVVEDGRGVSLGVSSHLPHTEQIVILIEDNPYTVAATFELSESLRAEVRTRVRMNRSTNVHALVRADGRIYSAQRKVRVTVSGCGV